MDFAASLLEDLLFVDTTRALPHVPAVCKKVWHTRSPDIFHMTLVSNDTYEAALQEVIGMGRVILK
jgi:hypothetical protein